MIANTFKSTSSALGAQCQHIIIVVPNTLHHTCVDLFIDVFPDAVIIGSQRAGNRHEPKLNVSSPNDEIIKEQYLDDTVSFIHWDGSEFHDEWVMLVKVCISQSI